MMPFLCVNFSLHKKLFSITVADIALYSLQEPSNTHQCTSKEPLKCPNKSSNILNVSVQFRSIPFKRADLNQGPLERCSLGLGKLRPCQNGNLFIDLNLGLCCGNGILFASTSLVKLNNKVTY